MNYYKQAVLQGLTFDTALGTINIIDLATLPVSDAEISLDSVGANLQAEIKDLKEGLVPSVTKQNQRTTAKLKLKIVKTVIYDRLEAAKQKDLSKDKQKRRKLLLKALDQRQATQLADLSEKQIIKELQSL